MHSSTAWSRPTRRTLLAAAAAAALTAGCDNTTAGEPVTAVTPPDPASLLGELARGLSPDNPYRDPDTAERSAGRLAARSLVDQVADEERDRLFAEIGFEVHRGTEPVTGAPFELYLASGADDRTWGAVLRNPAEKPRVVLEVPHPGFDINTERLGLDLYRRVSGGVLLVAGAHRQAAGSAADVAHNDRSMFHVLAVELARNGLDQVQLHGFADKNLPKSDAVVSTGSAPISALARDIADGLDEAGIRTCRAWSRGCGALEGRTNEQGRSAAKKRDVFVHIELNYAIRKDEAAWKDAVEALAGRIND